MKYPRSFAPGSGSRQSKSGSGASLLDQAIAATPQGGGLLDQAIAASGLLDRALRETEDRPRRRAPGRVPRVKGPLGRLIRPRLPGPLGIADFAFGELMRLGGNDVGLKMPDGWWMDCQAPLEDRGFGMGGSSWAFCPGGSCGGGLHVDHGYPPALTNADGSRRSIMWGPRTGPAGRPETRFNLAEKWCSSGVPYPDWLNDVDHPYTPREEGFNPRWIPYNPPSVQPGDRTGLTPQDDTFTGGNNGGGDDGIPGPGVKDQKGAITGMPAAFIKALSGAIDILTDFEEVIGIMYDSLPDRFKIRGMHSPRPQQKFWSVYNALGNMTEAEATGFLVRFAANIVLAEVEDWALGKVGEALDAARQAGDHSRLTGYQTGGFGQRYTANVGLIKAL